MHDPGAFGEVNQSSVYEQTTEEVIKPSDIEDIPEDSVKIYLNEAGTHPILTKQEEIELAQQIEKGKEAEQQLAELQPHRFSKSWAQLNQLIEDGAAARQRFIGYNLKLVISIAKKYTGQGLLLGDLINEGNLGLMHGVELFDWRRGYKFSTYGTYWIRQYITRAIADTGRTIRLPVHMVEKQKAAAKESQRFEAEFNRPPTDQEYAELAGIPLEKVSLFKKYVQPIISLDQPLSLDSGDEGYLKELVAGADDTETEAIKEVDNQGLAEAIHLSLANLTERERYILGLSYGLVDGEPQGSYKIGERIGISPQRANQIRNNALDKLRDGIAGHLLQKFRPD